MSGKSGASCDTSLLAIGDDPLLNDTSVFEFAPETLGLVTVVDMSVWGKRRGVFCGHWKGSLTLTVISANGNENEQYTFSAESDDRLRISQQWCTDTAIEDNEPYCWAVQTVHELPGRTLRPETYLKGFDKNVDSAYDALESIWRTLSKDSGDREPGLPPCFAGCITKGLQDSKDKLNTGDDRSAVTAAESAFRRKFPDTTSIGRMPLRRGHRQ